MILKRTVFVFILLCLINPFVYAQKPTDEESDQQINDFSLVGYGEKGEKDWDLAAKTADIFGDLIKLNNVVGNLYKEKEDVRLTADRGQFHKTKGLVHLEQNVVITTDTGAKLTTDTLDWDRKNKIVNTEDKVNIEKENMLTIAKGARGEPDLNKIFLKKDVQVNINPAQEKNPEVIEKEKTIITCDGPLQIDYAKNIATFNNNVKVDRKDLKIYSDIMDVYFTPESKESDIAEEEAPSLMGTKIRKVVARENVKIVRQGNLSYSDEAVYAAADKKIILSGNPKLIIYSAEDFNALIGD